MLSEISKEWNLFLKIKTILYKLFVEKIILYKNSKKTRRNLEIGPGEFRINNFETINIIKTKSTDYIGDAVKKNEFSE